MEAKLDDIKTKISAGEAEVDCEEKYIDGGKREGGELTNCLFYENMFENIICTGHFIEKEDLLCCRFEFEQVFRILLSQLFLYIVMNVSSIRNPFPQKSKAG